MDKKSRNLELEKWLIEAAGEEMMANHLGPNWNKFNEEFGFYPNMAMTVADLVWQHQQAKVEDLQKQVTDLDNRATQYALDEMATAKLNGELQKRVDEITNIATELAEYASYAEIVGGVTVNRSAVRSFCDKVFDFNRKVDQELEQALKGEGQ